MRLEVDLDELTGGVAAHHDVEEHLISWCLEEPGVVDEGHVDAAGVVRVGMDNGVVATRECGVKCADQKIDNEAVLDFADPEQIRAASAVHLGDDGRKLGDLAVAPSWCPACEVGADRALQLFRPARGVLLVEEVLEVPPRHVIGRRHPTPGGLTRGL